MLDNVLNSMTTILVSYVATIIPACKARDKMHAVHTYIHVLNTYLRMCTNYLDISFELPLEEELQSSGGIEFNTGQSQIYIPYTAIQHQKDTEGIHTYIHVYVQHLFTLTTYDRLSGSNSKLCC